MLTIQDIETLAAEQGLKLHASYPAGQEGQGKPKSLTVWFNRECVDAWVKLMTQLTEVPVDIYGTRQVTGSGSTDGRLFPGYEACLKQVNDVRAKIGLGPVFG